MPADYATLETRIARFIDAESRESFGDLLLEIHSFQRAANPAYDRYCAAFPTATAWQAIPALPQSVFKQTAVRAHPASETTRTFRTSGTTGEDYGKHHFKSLHLYQRAALRGWEEAGLSAVREVISLIPTADEAPFSSLSQMASWLTEGIAIPKPVPSGCLRRSPLRSGSSRSPTQKCEALTSPTVLFGTALAFLDWFDHLGDRQLTLPPGSLAVETGGYKGTSRQIEKPDLYARFTHHLGLPADQVVNEYGMTELSSQFYTRGLGQPHAHPTWARGLVIDPETNTEVPDGVTGVLRLFDAANLGSCCAIQTQDLAIRRGENFELIGRDPTALPRGCSRAADEMLLNRRSQRSQRG